MICGKPYLNNMKKTNIVTPLWERCRSIVASGNIELADQKLMELVWKLADYTMLGHERVS